ncbi:MAG: AAA family ATPase, partial [Microcoleus sp. SIO2G3]|nr:AAA family ATPase [Microcoleus sp. SIO2G3]
EHDGRATVWRRLPDGGTLVREDERFRPWLLVDRLDDLRHLGGRTAVFDASPFLYGMSKKEFRHRVGELTEMLALEDKLTQPVRKLSLGERMKAELLAALLHQPQVLFLDEPTLGLDVNAQVGVRDFLREYNRLTGATILLTSHYMADITALCQRVLLIYAGQLIYDGSLDGLIDRFAPYREVKVELANPLPEDKLSRFGELQAVEGREVRFLVRREGLTSAVSRILAELEVIDLTVTEPPVEEVIGRVFRAGVAS